MNSRCLFVLLVATALTGCDKKPQANNPGGGSPVTAPLDYLAAQGKAKKFAEKTITAAELTSAIQKFNAMEDRFPRDLNELVQQHYLQAPPAAPNGMTWAYNPDNGTVRMVAAPAPTGTPAPGTAPRPLQPK